MEIHEGHRERIKNRFLQEGLASFTEIQALEMLLFYSVPRSDTNTIAHRLLQAFGSLYNLFEAEPADIASVEGVGMHSAILIKLLPEITRKYWISGITEKPRIDSPQKAAAYIKPYLFGKPFEHVYEFCLDNNSRVKHADCISTGTIDDVTIYIRKVAECAMRLSSGKIIIAHNHPGGTPNPSNADIQTTSSLSAALFPLGIELIDHIILSDHSYISFVESNLIDQKYPPPLPRRAKNGSP